MRVLVTNDDGIEAEGIRVLAAALVARGDDVVVAAPDTDQSGCGASLGPLAPDAPIGARRLEVEGLDDFTAAHLHEGAKGKDGPPVVTLELLGDDGEDICVDVDPALLKKIVAKGDRFYVNVHTAEFPEGAIRGQLEE